MNNDISIDFASKGTRFLNYLLDLFGFYFIIFLHAMILDNWLGIIPEDGSIWLGVYYFVLYVMYHFIFELAFARTPGKFLTGTKVTDWNGNKPNSKTLFIRNLCRLIPFDPLSFLIAENGWHDSISKTYVVNK